jgi:hypothetical protein
VGYTSRSRAKAYLAFSRFELMSQLGQKADLACRNGMSVPPRSGHADDRPLCVNGLNRSRGRAAADDTANTIARRGVLS